MDKGKTLSEFTTEELQAEIEKRNLVNREISKTNKFLECKGMDEDYSLIIPVPINSVITVLEALKGDESYAKHFTTNRFTGELDSLLNIAITELNESVKTIKQLDKDHNVNIPLENTRAINALPPEILEIIKEHVISDDVKVIDVAIFK